MLPPYRPLLSASLPPVVLHNCSGVELSKGGTLRFRATEKNDISTEGPNCTISLCQAEEKDNLCLRATATDVPIPEERASGSRLTTIGRVVQSKTSEPETRPAPYSRFEPVWGPCMFSGSVLKEFMMAKVSVRSLEQIQTQAIDYGEWILCDTVQQHHHF